MCEGIKYTMIMNNKCQDVWGNKIHHDNVYFIPSHILTFVIHYRGVFYSLTHLDICYSLSWCILFPHTSWHLLFIIMVYFIPSHILTFVIHYHGVFYSLTHLVTNVKMCEGIKYTTIMNNKCQDVWGNKIHHDNE
jgi:hypothetical protein